MHIFVKNGSIYVKPRPKWSLSSNKFTSENASFFW